jgi:hypothetical protein
LTDFDDDDDDANEGLCREAIDEIRGSDFDTDPDRSRGEMLLFLGSMF